MYIIIDKWGLSLLKQINYQIVKGKPRYYYVGTTDEIPVIIVARGQELSVGQIWDTNSGNEIAVPGFCRSAHIGKEIGKLRMNFTRGKADLADDEQLVPLGVQIEFFVHKYDLKYRSLWGGMTAFTLKHPRPPIKH